ncbi:ARM repeat-containing protein [Neoconidiobolus thromboides FSU 785]|nr:ARM repeat-containing protein [Neoconidiobolus thromboides FSU 785]
MIECADTDAQVVPIAAALKPFTPALLLDQFGNYVVQCCLKFESPNNQFIFDAIYSRCSEIAQGRYGARAIRTCLDSQFTTQKQKELVSEALMRNAYSLSTNANGSLLLNWILDSQFTEHYMGIVVNLSGHLSQLCCHKLASSIIVRLINQQLDSQAREYLLYKLFFQNSGPVIKDILTDYSQGNQFVQKILNSPYLDEETKASIQMSVTKYNSQYIDHQQLMGYRRLLFDEAMAHSGHFLQNQALPIQHDPNFPSFNPGMNPGMPNTQDNPGNWSWGWNSQAQTQATLPNYITSMSTPSPNLFNQNNSYFMPTTAPSMNSGSVQPNESKDSKTSTSHIALNIN